MTDYFTLSSAGSSAAALRIEAGEARALPHVPEKGAEIRLVTDAGEFSAAAALTASCFDPSAVPFVRYAALFGDEIPAGAKVLSAVWTNGRAAAEFSDFAGGAEKREGEPLAAECTLMLVSDVAGARLLAGDNPLLRYVAGEGEGEELAFLPLVRPSGLREIAALSGDPVPAEEEVSEDGERVFSGYGIAGGAGAALLVGGRPALVFESARTPVGGEEQTAVLSSGVLSVGKCYGAELVGFAGEARVRRYGAETALGREFPVTLDFSAARAVGVGPAFALHAGSRLEYFLGAGETSAALVLDEGREIAAAAVAADGTLAVGYYDGELQCYRPKSGALERIGGAAKGTRAAAIASDGKHVAALRPSGDVDVYALTDAGLALEKTVGGEMPAVLSAANMSVVRLFAGTLSETPLLGENSDPVRVLSGVEGAALLAAVPGAAVLRLGDGSTEVVDPASGKKRNFPASRGSVTFSDSGAYAVLGSPHSRALLCHWNADECRPEPLSGGAFSGEAKPVPAGALVRSGGRVRLAAAYEDRTEFVFPSAAVGTEIRWRKLLKSCAAGLAVGIRTEAVGGGAV